MRTVMHRTAFEAAPTRSDAPFAMIVAGHEARDPGHNQMAHFCDTNYS